MRYTCRPAARSHFAERRTNVGRRIDMAMTRPCWYLQQSPSVRQILVSPSSYAQVDVLKVDTNGKSMDKGKGPADDNGVFSDGPLDETAYPRQSRRFTSKSEPSGSNWPPVPELANGGMTRSISSGFNAQITTTSAVTGLSVLTQGHTSSESLESTAKDREAGQLFQPKATAHSSEEEPGPSALEVDDKAAAPLSRRGRGRRYRRRQARNTHDGPGTRGRTS